MSTLEASNTDIEAVGRRSRRRRPSSSVAVSSADGSLCFSDSDDQNGVSEIEGIITNPHGNRGSSEPDCLNGDVDLESGDLGLKVYSAKLEEKDCRICHLKLVGGGRNQESGAAIELGCCCKGDLGAAHKKCAETWFKIKGNTTCEICGATALNVVVEYNNEAHATSTSVTAVVTAGSLMVAEPRRFWHGRRIMNFLLGCMIFAFVVSWLFHFNVLS